MVQNCDELFEREELSAAPDVGWPDCFNSGVFVFLPSKDTFKALIDCALGRGSFDGKPTLNYYNLDILKILIYFICYTLYGLIITNRK